ncbi:MAG: PH domain-containing protein [Patescibacteria group bacterium]
MQDEKFQFDGQRSDEDVIFVIKRHPWVLASAGFWLIGFIIVTVIFILLFGLSHITSFLIIAVILFFVIFGFYQWFVYNNYLYILTNQRIILIEQNGLFGRKITEAELEKIQNSTVEIKGLVKTVLNFGDITLRTAGIDPVMILSNVENPFDVQQKIIKHCKNYSDSVARPNIIR